MAKATNPFETAAARQKPAVIPPPAGDGAGDGTPTNRLGLVAQLMEAPESALPIDQIKPRVASTREVDDSHVLALQESIAALGLIEPLVVDRNHRLLAGEHRLSGCQRLKDTDLETYERWFHAGIPVRILDFDAEDDAERALQIEVAENEHRRDYTRTEIVTLAERLAAAGYRNTKGRPKKGEKALLPQLGAIIGKSTKTVRRILDASPPTLPRKGPSDLALLVRGLGKVNGDNLPDNIRPLFEQLVEGIRRRTSRD